MFLPNYKLWQHQSRAMTISLRFFAIAIILGFFAVSPAVGETIYSDSWTWSPSPNHPSGQIDIQYDEQYPTPDSITYVVGCGITEDNYNSYGHEYYVDTTITSPDGRSQTENGNGRAEVDLILDLNNPGEFFISSDHSYFCPIANNIFSEGNTSASIIVGISIACFELVSFDSAIRTAYLRRKVPCNTNCGDPEDTFTFRYDPALGPPQQLVVGEPYTRVLNTYILCSHAFAYRRYSGVCNCGNVEVPLPGILF